LQEVGAGEQRLSQASVGWQPPVELTTKPVMHCEHSPVNVLQLPEVEEQCLSQGTVPAAWELQASFLSLRGAFNSVAL